jgi:collagen triple helix repeat protein
MNNYGYFPTYTTMLPLYQTILGNYGIGDSGTQDSKPSRNKWYDNQNRFSNQQSSSDKEKANKGTTLGKEFTGGDGRDGFGGGTTSSSKGNDAGPSNKGHSFTDKQAMDAAINGLSQMGLEAATKTGVALGLNAPTNVALNFGLSGFPSGLASTVGQVAAQSFGMTTGTTLGAMALGTLGSMLGGPIGGLLGGLIGPTIGGLVADALNIRDEEVTRDAMEDSFGPITGRQIGAAYTNNIATHNMDMATINDMTLAEALNDAISGSKSLSPSQVANATAAVNNSIGMANPTSSWGRDMVGPVATAYAGAMASLGDLGKDTGSAADEASPVGGFASTGSFGGIGTDPGGYGTDVGGPIGGGAMSHGKAQDNFGGIGLSGVGGVTGETAADTAASTSAAESDTAGGTATGGTSEGTDSGTTGEGGANEGNDAGNDSGDNGSTGNDGDSGGSGGDGNAGGFGNDGGGGSGGDGDNNGGPNGGSDSQGTGEGQAGDGTGSGANGQNDGGDDGGW